MSSTARRRELQRDFIFNVASFRLGNGKDRVLILQMRNTHEDLLMFYHVAWSYCFKCALRNFVAIYNLLVRHHALIW